MKTQRFQSLAGRDSRGLPFPPDEGEGPSREDSDHGMRGQARASEGGTPRRRRSAHPLDSSDGQLVLQERPRSRAVARACAPGATWTTPCLPSGRSSFKLTWQKQRAEGGVVWALLGPA